LKIEAFGRIEKKLASINGGSGRIAPPAQIQISLVLSTAGNYRENRIYAN